MRRAQALAALRTEYAKLDRLLTDAESTPVDVNLEIDELLLDSDDDPGLLDRLAGLDSATAHAVAQAVYEALGAPTPSVDSHLTG